MPVNDMTSPIPRAANFVLNIVVLLGEGNGR